MTTVSVGKMGAAVYPRGAAIGPRTIAEFEFVWILRGSTQWSSNGQLQKLLPGQLFLVQPGARHRWLWDRRGPTTHGYVHFTLGASGCSEAPGNWPLLRNTSDDDPLPATLRYLLRLDATSQNDRDTAAELVRFVLVLFARGPGMPGRAPLPAAVTDVVEHVHQAWAPSGVARALSLDELSTAASVSSGHLSRIFRHRFGIGPVTAIELLRLARAATHAVAGQPVDHGDRKVLRLRRSRALLAPVPDGLRDAAWSIPPCRRRA